MFVVFPKDTFYDVPLAPLKNSVKSQINNIHPDTRKLILEKRSVYFG